jgi:hypothetical protein
MMIAQPDAVTLDQFELGREEAWRKKQLPAIARAGLERFEEGTCAQILHVGPFSAEGPTILKLHAFIQEQGHSFNGKLQKAPRDLLERSAAKRAREVEDDHPLALL